MDKQSATPPHALELSNITKSFGPNQVLRGVSMSLTPGKVTALLGANGAGKSTLIKILAGVYEMDGGEVKTDGQIVEITNPVSAATAGIQTVHQQVKENIVPGLSVAENLVFNEIVLNQIPPVRSLKALLPRAREIAETLKLGWTDDLLKKDVFELGIADAQMILLARALIQNPKVLILDEPTSTLSEAEVSRLFEFVAELKERGTAILYVSHHLAEIDQIADDLQVLRDGTVVDTQNAPFNMEAAVTAMLGSSLQRAAAEREIKRSDRVCMQLRGVKTLPRSEAFDLDINYGEVTGVIGLIGAGKSELLRGIYGAKKWESGSISIDGVPTRMTSTAKACKAGIYMVPEDRAAESMLPEWSVTRTVTLPFLDSVSRFRVMNRRSEKRRGTDVIEQFNVVGSAGMSMDNLSGGNQQKAVVGRWLIETPKVMLLDEPFRGVDIGARSDICTKIGELAASGACVILASSDIEEIFEVADRILVMVDGNVTIDDYADKLDTETIIAGISEVSKDE
ncbi:MAG: sugar ABC transporter ATP-binding protein [Actinomycetaceae bacterium]|nr:sugar ABC transporter ATP-binding protein [Actinomycetaceae bacterium]